MSILEFFRSEGLPTKNGCVKWTSLHQYFGFASKKAANKPHVADIPSRYGINRENVITFSNDKGHWITEHGVAELCYRSRNKTAVLLWETYFDKGNKKLNLAFEELCNAGVNTQGHLLRALDVQSFFRIRNNPTYDLTQLGIPYVLVKDGIHPNNLPATYFALDYLPRYLGARRNKLVYDFVQNYELSTTIMPIEVAIISELEREFPDLCFQRQYRIGKYRVDAVILQESIPVIAIEIDEYQHKRTRSSEYDKLRENYIITAYPDLVILRIDTTAKEFSLAPYFNIIQELCK